MLRLHGFDKWCNETESITLYRDCFMANVIKMGTNFFPSNRKNYWDLAINRIKKKNYSKWYIMIQNKRLKGGLSKDKYMEILLTYLDDKQTVPFFSLWVWKWSSHQFQSEEECLMSQGSWQHCSLSSSQEYCINELENGGIFQHWN